MKLVFAHGAGGYDEDRPLADSVAAMWTASAVMPRLPDEDMSVRAWTAALRTAIPDDAGDAVLVGHSFGASIVLHLLAAEELLVSRVVLLAMPNWGPDGWDVSDYVPPVGESAVPVTVHHCQDDDVVPFAHLALNAARLPSARCFAYAVGGHQFSRLAEAITRDATSG